MTNSASPPPRALIIDLAERFGGASSRVAAMVNQAPEGTMALAALEGSPAALEVQKNGGRLHLVGRRKTDPRILSRLVHLIREHGYQVIDPQNIQSKFWGSLTALLTNTPLVSTLNSWYANEHGANPLKGFIYNELEHLTNWHLTRYIVVSREIQSQLLNRKVDPARIDLIYNAVEIQAEKIPSLRQEIFQQFQLPEDAVICLAVGRLVWIKGHAQLVSAFTQLRETNLYAFIVGEGELRKSLEQQIQENGLEKRVHLLGYAERSRTLSITKACDIFVMPSLYEGTPVALLEAAALERPIVATRVGGVHEMVEDEQQALLIESENPEALAQALLRLARDPQLAARLGRQARSRVTRQFSLETQIQLTLDSYRKAIETWHARSESK